MNKIPTPPKPPSDSVGAISPWPDLSTRFRHAKRWLQDYWPLLIIALVLGIVGAWFVSMAIGEFRCLRNGYPDHAWMIKNFCIMIEDGNTVIVPLKEVLNGG